MNFNTSHDTFSAERIDQAVGSEVDSLHKMRDNNRRQSMKREKSHADSTEREKKRVKFNFNLVENLNTQNTESVKERSVLHNRIKQREKGILKHRPPVSHCEKDSVSNEKSSGASVFREDREARRDLEVGSITSPSPSEELILHSAEANRQNTFTMDGLLESRGSLQTSSLIPALNDKTKTEKRISTDQFYPPSMCEENREKENTSTLIKRKMKAVILHRSENAPKITNVKERKVSLNLIRKTNKEGGGAPHTEEQQRLQGDHTKRAAIAIDLKEIDSKPNKHVLNGQSIREWKSHVDAVAPRDFRRMCDEIQLLKENNKRLEAKLRERNCRERDLTNQQRTINEQNQIQTSKIIRNNRREIAVLLSELKSKERLLANLEKQLIKQQNHEAITHLDSGLTTERLFKQPHSARRISLTRSLSAAAAFNPSKLTHKHHNKPSNSNEKSRSFVAAKQRDDLLGKSNGTKRRYVSKLEQMQKQIEIQQREINSLNDRLQAQNPNLKTLSQLSVSVPTVFEGEKNEGKTSSRSTSGEICESRNGEHESLPANDNSLIITSSSISCIPSIMPQVGQLADDSDKDSMWTSEELRCCKSLDIFGTQFSSLEQQQQQSTSLRYSSLISLATDKRKEGDELAEENEMLRAELQETRDHAELLEFRILEFTEGIQRATSLTHLTRDQATNTTTTTTTTAIVAPCSDDAATILQQSPPPPPPPINEDLSLPLSVDSGLELNIVDTNYKLKLSDYRKSLLKLEAAAGLSESSSVAHLSSLLDWVSDLSGFHYETASMSPRSPVQKKMGLSSGVEDRRLDDNNTICESDLTMLAAKLQESLSNPNAQEQVLEETIIKLRWISVSLSRLHSRVNSLSFENKELQEALHALNESHETRTEASGTESELVNGKTPSMHSDLSDSESDDSPRTTKSATIDTATSFQESGIFDSSCEMVNASSQTVQESDEYLVAALEGENVTLCKIEYDTIVATERSLQREIEMLQFERDQLATQVASVQEKLAKASSNTDASEVLSAQVRLLEERLEISERQRRQYFDEKCEIEEAENDARLLSQRLESQLEAAREMESLLSASLSQEQEFCRELQRRVREMHLIDKGRRMHEEVLEKESKFCRRREAALMIANDSQKSQLTFALYGLILAQFWRRLAAHNSEAIVPYSAVVDTNLSMSLFPSSPQFNVEMRSFTSSSSFLPSFPCASECEKCNCKALSRVSVRDACTQMTTDEDDVLERQNNRMNDELPEEPIENEFSQSMEVAQDQPKRGSLVINDGSTISEREEFYLAQIESLQKERRILREDYEHEQTLLIQQLQNMKSDLERLRLNLEESQREKCKLLFKLEEAQSVITGSDKELKNQAKELKREFSKSVEMYQQEQKAMQDQYEERLLELRRSIDIHEQRFTALLQQYSVLQHELEPYLLHSSLAGIAADEYASDGGSCNGKILTTKDLLSAVRELMRSESSTKQRLNELEKKECAYRETINEADRIMSSHVTVYAQRIEDLEASLEQKCLRINQLETSEERLRSAMKSNWKSGEGARITELLDRLIETENSELHLKERVWNLERSGKELQIKFAEAEKAQENLRGELRDQEELVQRLMTLSTENNALTSQLQEAHEAARRASDIQQSENYWKNRVDELESSENGLRDVLKQTEHIMKQRERKFRDQVINLEEEVSSLRGQLELRANESKQSKDTETSLRQHIDNFKDQIHSLEKELKDSSSENICHETQHRSEVTKLRSQLKLTNGQLTELDTLNGELKERFEAAEAAMKQLAIQLEDKSKRHEKEMLSLNLQLARKDSKLEEYEVHLQQISHSNLVDELDFIATSPLLNLQRTLDSFITNSKSCESCCKIQDEHLETLNGCLRTLNELVNGRNSQSDSESEGDFETIRVESLGSESYSTTPVPRCPAREERGELSSGEAETNSSVYSLPFINDSSVDGGEGPSPKVLPMVPPRPRRDAKNKKKIRKTVKREGSLLDELKESTTVEKGSFYGQCPPSAILLEELEEKVRQLQEVIAKKDQELQLADGEAHELQSRLMDEDELLAEKSEEATRSNEALASLRQQLLVTVQEYEFVRRELEAEHKVNMSELTKKVEALSEDLLRLAAKARLKDKIIHTLISQIRCIFRTTSTTILVNQVRKLTNIPNNNESLPGNEMPVLDYDVEKTCQMLHQPYQNNQVPAEPAEPVPSTLLDAANYKSLPSLSSSSDVPNVVHKQKSRSASDFEQSDPFTSVLPDTPSSKPRNLLLPPLEPPQKSRIPRFRPLSGPSPSAPLKHDDFPFQREACLKSSLLPKRRFQRRRQQQQQHQPQQSAKSTASSRSELSIESSSSDAKSELKPLAKVVPKQRPMAKTTATTTTTTTTTTPRPKSVVGEEESPAKFLTDARRIKRMVTGLRPLSASVDCSSAPEFVKQPRPPTPSCVPRPTDLRITRRVGIDGAVIAWRPLEHDCVAGFQVIVGGRVVQQVRSPHRTKALVTGLPFPSSFTIGLVTVAQDGRCSTPTLVVHDSPNAYKTKAGQNASSPPPPSSSLPSTTDASPRRALPTCL